MCSQALQGHTNHKEKQAAFAAVQSLVPTEAKARGLT